MNKIKKHIGLLLVLIIICVFPISLSSQTKLSMKVIVTGIAVDKVGDNYKVTAQIVKTTPSTESAGSGAEIDFITDEGPTVASAVSKLSYKAGKVSAFSHTNFIIIGNSVLDEDVTKCLDYFVRDKIIKNSALVVVADKEASEEIKKTKQTELSVGIGLQKVFLLKEKESDGIMMTVIDFLNENKKYSKSATISQISLKSDSESSDVKGDSSADSSNSGSESSSSSGGEPSSGGESSSSSSSSSGGTSGGGSSQSNYQYFEPQSAIACFVDGKFVGKLENEEEIMGYMLAYEMATSGDMVLDNIEEGMFSGSKFSVVIKKKSNNIKFRYENEIPCVDVHVKIAKSSINEILGEGIAEEPNFEEYDYLKKCFVKKIQESVAKCFIKSKEMGLDVFGAYDLAYKFHYNKTNKYYKDYSDFIDKLKLNVEVEINTFDY